MAAPNEAHEDRTADLGLGGGKRLCLLDGMALAYRGHFALIRSPRLSSRGLNTSAPFVFANTLLDILSRQEPSHIAAVFDTPEPTRRHREYAEYKATREAMPEDLSAALPYVFRLCEAFRIPVLRVPGYEADDVIGTLAQRAEAEGYTTYLVTPDKDFAQLVSKRTLLYRPGRQGNEAEILGVPEVLAQWQVAQVRQVIDVLGLMGDTSDNVPGVPSIGEKTAQKLIAEYGSVEELLAHADQIKGKRGEVLVEHRDQALLSKRLVTIDLDVPLECAIADLARRPPDDRALRELFVELEFGALGKRVLGDDFEAAPQLALASAQPAPRGPAEGMRTIADTAPDYRLVDTPEARAELAAAMAGARSFAFDMETTGLDPKTDAPIGLAVSFTPGTGFYVPVPEDREAAVAVLGLFRPALEDPGIEKVGHNLKFDVAALLWSGIEVRGRLFDTMVAAALAVPDLRRSLDYLSQALLGYRPIPITELIGEKGEGQRSMREVPLGDLARYAAEDADVALQLRQALEPLLVEKGQVAVFERAECPLVPVLARMEREGIRVDVKSLEGLGHEMEREIERAGRRIEELAGEPFNLNSPSQLGNVLFDRLKLDPNARRTQKSKQYRTDEQVLSRLAYHHEIAREILSYRLCTKLKSTYLDMLPGAIFAPTGRIHTNYEQVVAATGRLQSSNPNLQNIPVRTEQGREIRKAFVPRGEGYALLSADYSQIELRVIAAISGDERMGAAFRAGEDIHGVTASRIFGVPQEMVSDEMRRQAKTVNFGIIYGISAFGLAERLGISRLEAATIIDQYLDEYPGVRRYMEETVEFAREHGYVQTLLGRRRYLRDIASRNAATRQAAERNAINSPIQGTAADMIKLAMVTIDAEQQRRGWRTRMLLQVHDELVFDLWREEEDEVREVVARCMQEAIPLSVPIEVEIGTGDTWLDAH
ncbi:MAG: DNA polymerase I [Gemmatimonadota bacterium]